MKHDDLQKVLKCLALFSSDKDGEVLAAARAFHRISTANQINIAGLFTDIATMRKKIKQLAEDNTSLRAAYALLKIDYNDLEKEHKSLENKPYWKKVAGL